MPCIDLAEPESGDLGASPATDESGIAKGSVLFIEDEEILRTGVSKMLRKAGIPVLEGCDGATAVSLFRANESQVDAVLLNVTLPDMSGREVLRELRRIRPDVTVILTSAFAEDKGASSTDEQPAWGYVRKPYQLSELARLLRKALDKPRTRRNTAG
jgi:CheY-like chemotaxis protein